MKEEAQLEEIKRLQVQAGIIPKSSLEKISWMYPEKRQQDLGYMGGSKESAEEYLLGKSITDRDLREHNRTETGPKKIVPVIRQSNASAENEAFTRMMEDPLMHIKLKEQEARNKLVDNPLTMEQIR